MDIIQVVVLALVQGLAEFLPVGTAGHLVVTGQILGWPGRGLPFDVAIHLGTLLAVLVYFWRDVGRMLYGLVSPLLGRAGEESRLVWNVIVATLPLAVAGYALYQGRGEGAPLLDALWSDPVLIGATTIGFGLLLWLADALGRRIADVGDMRLAGALFIGFSQVLALIPGTSRTGIAITAARLLGYNRDEAARFALLLSIPAIAGVGFLAGRELLDAGDLSLTTDALVGLAVSFVAALAGIAAMMAWVRRASFLPFVVYRVLLGAFLIYWLYQPAA